MRRITVSRNEMLMRRIISNVSLPCEREVSFAQQMTEGFTSMQKHHQRCGLNCDRISPSRHSPCHRPFTREAFRGADLFLHWGLVVHREIGFGGEGDDEVGEAAVNTLDISVRADSLFDHIVLCEIVEVSGYECLAVFLEYFIG